jgi:hypothetical protein
MTSQHNILISEPLYLQLKTLADAKGQTVKAYVQEANPLDLSFLVSLPVIPAPIGVAWITLLGCFTRRDGGPQPFKYISTANTRR